MRNKATDTYTSRSFIST